MHTSNSIYLDHQASTPTRQLVLDKMAPFWNLNHGNPHSSEHQKGWNAHESVERARREVADLIQVDSQEIVFTSGATEANNLIICGLSNPQHRNTRRNRILVSAIDHKCVLEAAYFASKTFDCEVLYIPVDRHGRIEMEALSGLLDDRALLVSVALVNNEIGTIQDLATISEMCVTVGAFLHSDIAQATSSVPISHLGQITDAVSISGHKFGGPMGIGALYINHRLQSRITPIFHGGGQENGLRSGTNPLPLCVGLGAAAEFLGSTAFEVEKQRIRMLRDKFVRSLITSSHDISLNGPELDARHIGNANLCFAGSDAQDLLLRLQPNVAASSGSACNSSNIESSYVLDRIGVSSEHANSSIRFSFGHTNSSGDVERAIKNIFQILES